jgi:hypothetical protein
MATTQLFDFSDLGQAVSFKFGEKEYTIPPISSQKAKKLFALSKEVSAKQTKREKLLKEESTTEPPEDFEDSIDDLFNFQVDFICLAVADVTKEEVSEWPTRLMSRVIKLINDIISGDLGQEEKKS